MKRNQIPYKTPIKANLAYLLIACLDFTCSHGKMQFYIPGPFNYKTVHEIYFVGASGDDTGVLDQFQL